LLFRRGFGKLWAPKLCLKIN